MTMLAVTSAFWSCTPPEIVRQLDTGPGGLSQAEAAGRLEAHATERLTPRRHTADAQLLLAQFLSPIVLILIAAAALSWFLSDRVDTLIILTIVFASGLLGFWQERGAAQAVDRLMAAVRMKADVLRGGRECEIASDDVVPGDIVRLKAGDLIPADGLVLDAKDLFINEAALTGETFPVEKSAGTLPAATPLAQRTNSVFLGTHVVSGTARVVAVRIGLTTEFGAVAARLAWRAPETEFERGVRRFGYLLMEVTAVLVLAIFAINALLARPLLDSFLFSLALAVGLTPQLLPAIISVNLAHGAKRMAERGVIVKRLAAIENFGSMTVLCSDKTGTLTEGQITLDCALDVAGRPSERVQRLAYVNASFESGFFNPIDQAIRSSAAYDLSAYGKLDEVPYDFVRKRLSILTAVPDGPPLLITKGAVAQVLAVCTSVETAPGVVEPLLPKREALLATVDYSSRRGLRVLGVAYREMPACRTIAKQDEREMIFAGFLLFEDPPKAGIRDTLARLHALGVSLKMVTGDHRLIAAHVADEVGIAHTHLLTGGELRDMSEEALVARVTQVDVFAEVEPNQKERIVRALKQAGHVVGYGGDGINDASALHAADVGLSVDGAVDVAKEAADIVLLKKDLAMLVEGVMEGRRTFANTLKYVFMATSANFGNMFSMAGASLFLPFLPLLPKQILLTNLLTDIPEMTIAADRVDRELIDRPRRWDIGFIRRFMVTFGLVSSLFDYLTFGVLLWVLHATVGQFRTGWFVESVLSASLIVLVIRTRRPCYRSGPSRALWVSTVAAGAVTLLLPVTPVGTLLGFEPLPPTFWPVLAGILLVYGATAELAKYRFYAAHRSGERRAG